MSIDITHTHPDGTLVSGTARGDGTAAILKAHGLRWSGNLGAWYVPRSRDTDARQAPLDALAAELRAAGHELTVHVDNTARPTSEVLADRVERSSLRAQRFTANATSLAASSADADAAAERISDGIPFGQPVLLGHHSQRRHERALQRRDRHLQRSSEAFHAAQTATRRAAAAAANAAHTADAGPQFAARRIDGLTADRQRILRRLNGHTRTIAVHADGRRDVESYPPATGDDRQRLTHELERLDEQLTYWQDHHAGLIAAGRGIDATYGRDNIRVGDQVQVAGSWYDVLRVNAKSVTVPSSMGSWTDTVKYEQLRGHRQRPGQD